MGASIAASLPRDRYEVICTAASEKTVNRLSEEFPDISFSRNNVAAVTEADIVVLAIKPYVADEVIDEIKPYLKPGTTVISVMATFSIADLESKFMPASADDVANGPVAHNGSEEPEAPLGPHFDWEQMSPEKLGELIDNVSESVVKPVVKDEKSFNILKVIPNTAIRNGKSATFVAASARASKESVEEVLEIFNRSGKAFQIKEKDMNACMVLASCGIAFFLRFIRAAAEGSVELGLRPAFATEVAALTAAGAASLLEEGSHPEVEIDKVTTAGGSTIKGLIAMETNGFTGAVIAALKASAGK